MKNITIVSSEDGDWQGLYVNGKLVYQNHSITTDDILRCVGIVYEYHTADNEWLEMRGKLPEKLSDVKLTF